MLSTEQARIRIEKDLNKLKEYRQANNLSKEGMGNTLEVTGQTYRYWQSGRSTPDVENWLKIQHLLGGN